jgi:hypothetical protein
MAGKVNKREAAIAALLTERTVEEAAAKAGISYRALKLWLTQPDFAAAYRAARAAILDRTVASLLRTCTKAVDRLEQNLDSPNPQAANRAALAILAHAFRGMEALDLRAEIEAIKRQLLATANGQGGDSNGDSQAGGGAAEVGTAAANDDAAEPDAEPDAAGAGS